MTDYTELLLEARTQLVSYFGKLENVVDVTLVRIDGYGKSLQLRLTLEGGKTATVMASLMFPSFAALTRLNIDLIIDETLQTMTVQGNRVVHDGVQPWAIVEVDAKPQPQSP